MQLTDKIKKYHIIIGIAILSLFVVGIVVTGGNEIQITLASEIDTSNTYDPSYDVAVSGHYAYYGDGTDIVVSDISDKASPQEIARLELSSISFDIAVSGDYAYVANGENGLVILDITDPAAPVKVGSYVTDSVCELEVVGNYAYLIECQTDGFIVVDITNPTSPSLAKYYNLPSRPRGLDVVGNYAYIATGKNGLIILDIIDPTEPKHAGKYEDSSDDDGRSAFFARDVAVKGNYAYVVGGRGLDIIDITNPEAPTLIRNKELENIVNSVTVANDYLYAEQYSEYDILSSKKLVILDITDPTIPRIVGKYRIEQVLSCTVKDNYIFVATGSDGVKILTIN